jgi:hypothetical protein
VEPLGKDNCPSGTAELTSSAVTGGAYSSYSFGIGPCGTVVPAPKK